MSQLILKSKIIYVHLCVWTELKLIWKGKLTKYISCSDRNNTYFTEVFLIKYINKLTCKYYIQNDMLCLQIKIRFYASPYGWAAIQRAINSTNLLDVPPSRASWVLWLIKNLLIVWISAQVWMGELLLHFSFVSVCHLKVSELGI